MKNVKKCDLCGGKNFLLVYKDRTDKLLGKKDGKFDIIRCKGCRLCMTTPVLSSKGDFEKYYPKTYYSYGTKTGKSLKDKAALYAYYLFYSKDNIFNPLRYLFYPLSYFVRGTSIKKGARILDIGGGGGFFLSRMRDLGMQPYCIELGEEGYNSCVRNKRYLMQS